MKTLTYLWIVILMFTLTSSVSLADKERHRTHDVVDTLEIDGLAESLLGVIYSEEGLEFQVISYGCTEKSHFVVQRLNPASQTISQLLLIRVVPDYCDGYVPFGIRLTYTYKELGLEEDDTSFNLLNPLSRYRVNLDD